MQSVVTTAVSSVANAVRCHYRGEFSGKCSHGVPEAGYSLIWSAGGRVGASVGVCTSAALRQVQHHPPTPHRPGQMSAKRSRLEVLFAIVSFHSLKSNITDIQISCELFNKRYRNGSNLGTFRDRTEKFATSRDSPEATNRFQDISRYALEPRCSELSNASGLVR